MSCLACMYIMEYITTFINVLSVKEIINVKFRLNSVDIWQLFNNKNIRITDLIPEIKDNYLNSLKDLFPKTYLYFIKVFKSMKYCYSNNTALGLSPLFCLYYSSLWAWLTQFISAHEYESLAGVGKWRILNHPSGDMTA